MYKGVRTETISNPGVPIYRNNPWWMFWKSGKEEVGRRFPKSMEKKFVYYEKAFDANGEGLNLGDRVKVIHIENNPAYSLREIYEIKSIFEGDLILGDERFYCYPRNVVLTQPNID